MRYSQPFGTPQPPLGSYPRFVNGDPVTGTEGSIPPASSIDETQIEIVEVIRRTKAGELDRLPDPLPPLNDPDHNDLTQLWQSLMWLFAQKWITTPIVKTVHGTGADFPDLVAAMKWLSRYMISNTGFVTFMVAPGKWTYTQQVEINHPMSNRVAIQGGALLGATPQPPNVSVTGYHSATDGTNQIIYLRSVHSSELAFTGGVNGFRITTPGCTFRYLLLTGSQTAAPPTAADPFQGCGFVAFEDFWVDGISIWGFGAMGMEIRNAACWSFTSLSLTICYCGNYGIDLNAGSIFLPSTAFCILASNLICGIQCTSGYMTLGKLNIRGCNTAAVTAGVVGAVSMSNGSELTVAAGSVIAINNGNGLAVAGATTCSFVNSNCNSNTGYGLIMDGGICWLSGSNVTGNSLGGIYLLGPGSSVTALGALYGSSNPAANTLVANTWITA